MGECPIPGVLIPLLCSGFTMSHLPSLSLSSRSLLPTVPPGRARFLVLHIWLVYRLELPIVPLLGFCSHPLSHRVNAFADIFPRRTLLRPPFSSALKVLSSGSANSGGFVCFLLFLSERVTYEEARV